jgi:hypothetical protein
MRNFVVALLALCTLGCGRDGLVNFVDVRGAGGATWTLTGGAGSGAPSGAAVGSGAAGTSALGGASASGTAGSGAGGTAGASASAGTNGLGGASGAAGAGGAPTRQRPPSGCGRPLPKDQPETVPGTAKGYLHFTVMGTGATLAGPEPAKAGPRTFWVRPPADYDPNHKYRVVYLGQSCGGYQIANTNTYALYQQAGGGNEEAIYVALDVPENMANADCYDYRAGPSSQEWEAFELIHSAVDETYCVDDDNVFVSGYSAGGYLANMWGCYFAGDGAHPWNGTPGGDPQAPARRFAPWYHVRGQASIAGGDPDNNPPCNGAVAGLWIADNTDGHTPVDASKAALARVLEMNGCAGANSPTVPWHTELTGSGGCVEYTSCPKEHPVIFCTTAGFGHSDQHQLAIAAFNLFFDEATARP